MRPINLINSFQEVFPLGLRAMLWRANIVITLDRFLQLILAQIVGLKADLATIQCHKVYAIAVFDNSHRAIKGRLILAKGSWLRGVCHASLYAHGLEPAIVEVDGVFFEGFERIPK